MHTVAYARCFQVDILERDAFEVLCLIRSIKNSFAPMNRIPPEVLQLIPDHCEDEMDQSLIALTHVCRGWRDIFTSRSSLWTRLDFKNIDKTCTYIKRSQSSPLEICLRPRNVIADAFPLIAPHILRLKSLTIKTLDLPNVLTYICFHAPLLERLDIDINSGRDRVLDSVLFNGNLPSLRELRLHRVITHFPWKNLANLLVFDLRCDFHPYKITQLLDFFESAPLLHTVKLAYPVQDSSTVPPSRIVPLSHLKILTFDGPPPPSILLRHLHIPFGASLILGFPFHSEESPLLDYLPERCPNFGNLSHITCVNLLFNSGFKHTRLSGPSGSLRVLPYQGWGFSPSYIKDGKILRSLGRPMLSTIRRLAISKYKHPIPQIASECPVLQTLTFTNNLRTLTLIDCDNLPFILALDPEQNSSDLALCPNMKELVLYVYSLLLLNLELLIRMAKNRASRGTKLPLIRIISQGPMVPEEEMIRLREHVTTVGYSIDDAFPAWDNTSYEDDGGDQ